MNAIPGHPDVLEAAPQVAAKPPTVIMVGADKGGVGKTMTCRALLDYFDYKKVSCRVFDTQYPAGVLRRFRSDADVVDIASIQDQMIVFDGIEPEHVTVLDVCGGLLSPTISALERAGLLDDVRAGVVRMIIMHVLGPTRESLDEIGEAARRLGSSARHLLVKNYTNETTYKLASDPEYARYFEIMAPGTVTIPKLPALAAEDVNAKSASFAEYAANASNSRILRGNVHHWLTAVWSQFDRVGIAA